MQEYAHEIRSLSIELMNIITKIILLFFIALRSGLLSNEELIIPKIVRTILLLLY